MKTINKLFRVSLSFIALFFFSATLFAQWTKLPGAGTYVGAGADGNVYTIGGKEFNKDGPVFKWNGSDWEKTGKDGLKVTSDKEGQAWVINSKREIWCQQKMGWAKMPGAATDIAIGGNGAIFVVGGKEFGKEGEVFKWDKNVNNWVVFGDKKAVHIAVDENGFPYIIDMKGEIWKRNKENLYSKLPGAASDIGIGANGSVWILGIGANKSTPFEWQGNDWRKDDGGGVQISVDNNGKAWLVNAKREIFKKG